jgi:chemotaxis response regulator CheB
MAEKKKPTTKKKSAVKKKPAKQTKVGANAKKALIKPKKTNDFPIVGLGASAGGLEALEAFF